MNARKCEEYRTISPMIYIYYYIYSEQTDDGVTFNGEKINVDDGDLLAGAESLQRLLDCMVEISKKTE